MTRALTITKEVHFGRAKRGRKLVKEGAEEKAPDPGRIPRVARLMALAIHMEGLIRQGEVTDYAALARLAHVTRARVTQIMNFTHLAPNIQEEILDLPRSPGDRDSIRESMLRPIAAVPDWRKQRVMWRELAHRMDHREAPDVNGLSLHRSISTRGVGWKNYFRLAETPRVFYDLDEWIRHRLRAIQLKHWKRGRTAYRELVSRGLSRDRAAQVAANTRRWWRNSGMAIHIAIPNRLFDELGLPRLGA